MNYRITIFGRGFVLALSLAIALGTALGTEVEAGTRAKGKAKRAAAAKAKQTVETTVPSPIVDDSPINPGAAKADSSAKDTTDGKKASAKGKK